MDVTKLCQEKDCYLVEYGYWVDYDKKVFSRNNIVPNDILYKFLVNKNTGLFKTIFTYNIANIDEAHMIGDLYFDFDDKEYEKVKTDALRTIDLMYHLFGIESKNIDIYFSGNKGIHLIISKEMLGVSPNKYLNSIYKEIITTIFNATENKTLDTKIYDNKRLFRIPNTRHEKSMLYKIPISYEELVNLNSKEITELAKKPRLLSCKYENKFLIEKANAVYLKYVDKTIEKINKSEEIKNKNTNNVITSNPPCILHLYRNGADSGNRNNAAAMLTSFLRNKGYDYSKVYKIVKEWNENNSNPLKDAELSKTCKSMFNSNNSYGCTSFQIISVCDEDNCPLKRKKR